MNAYQLAALRPICNVGTTGRDVVQLGAVVNNNSAGAIEATVRLEADGLFPMFKRSD